MRLKQNYQALSFDARRAFWLIITLALGTFAITAYVFPALLAADWWAKLLTNLIPFLIGLGSLGSAWLVLKQRQVLGGMVFLSILYIGMVLLAVSLKGLGFLLACVVFITSTYIASLVFPRKLFIWAPIASLLVCSLILLIDTYAFWERDWISARDIRFTSIISIFILVIYLFFVLRQFRRFSLGTKLVFVSLALTILPMALVGSMGYQSSRTALEAAANQSLATSAAQIAARLDAFMLNNLDTLRTEANLNDFRDLLILPFADRSGSAVEQRVTEALISLRQRDPVFIVSYFLLDLNGIDIADTNTAAIGSSQYYMALFQHPVYSGLPYVSPVILSSQEHQPTIYFSAPVRDMYGEIVGVLCAGFNAEILQQQLVLQEDLKANYAYGLIVDEYSIIRADSLEPAVMNKSIVSLDDAHLEVLRERSLVPEMTAAKELVVALPELAGGLSTAEQQPNFSGIFQLGTKRTGDPDEPLEQAGAVKMKTQPWYVVMVQPRSVLLAPVIQLNRGSIVLGVIAALVGVAFSVVIAQYFSNRLTHLTEAASQIAQGNLSARASIGADDELGTLATVFNQMSNQLEGLIGTLEQRVADRTKALSASVEVSRRLSTLLDVDQLVKTVVEQLQDAFHYYHVHIYLLDDKGENLVMVGGTGEAGKAMLAKGHTLPRGKGLVGRAAENLSPVLVEDVSKAPEWLPNPLLPLTQAELAVPILIGENVYGVLDVQHDRVGGLTQVDADLIQSIANQVAIALANARSYADAQHRANREAMISAIAQRIQRTTSTEDALRVTARELGRAIGAETSVHLGARWEERKVKKS
jgi:putative methionine-R-sulfoxide reductase with GAF domain